MATEGPVSTAEIERLFIIVLEEVMMELDVPGVVAIAELELALEVG